MFDDVNSWKRTVSYCVQVKCIHSKYVFKQILWLEEWECMWSSEHCNVAANEIYTSLSVIYITPEMK